MDELKALIHQAQTGAPQPFEEIVRRFQDMAVGYAYSVLGDFHLAEDAAQEAFIRAHADLEKLKEPAAFPGWLRRIVFTQCSRFMRRKPVETGYWEEIDNRIATEPDPAQAMEVLEMKKILQEAIQALPESQRQVMTLFYISNYSQKEIVKFLEVPLTTVQKRLHDARKRLKERIFVMIEDDLQDNRPSKDDRFVKKVMEFIAPNRKDHGEKIYDMIETDTPSVDPYLHQWRNGRIAHSTLDWEASRIACMDDEVIAIWGVYELALRIGTACIRTAGANLDHMRRNYTDANLRLRENTARACIEKLQDRGYDLSIAFYDKAFHSRLGYICAWRALDWWIHVDEFPTKPPDFELHEFDPVHREDLTELYNRENENMTATTVRPTYLRNKEPNRYRGLYWTDDQRNPVGYITFSDPYPGIFSLNLKYREELDKGEIPDIIRQRFEEGWAPFYTQPLSQEAALIVQEREHRWLIVEGGWQFSIQKSYNKLRMHVNLPNTPHRLDIEEAVGDPEQILQVLGSVIRQPRPEVNAYGQQIYFDRLPCRSALGKRLRKMDSCRISYKERGDGNSYMIRILNLKSLFEKLSTELSHRLERSPLANWQGDLLISNGEEEIALIIKRSKVKVAAAKESKHAVRGGQEIAQFIVGTDSPHAVARMNDIDLSGDANQLIEVLFPAQAPQMRNQDL